MLEFLLPVLLLLIAAVVCIALNVYHERHAPYDWASDPEFDSQGRERLGL